MITYTYCPQCSNKLVIRPGNPYCNTCKVTFYRNSKPTAGVLPIRDGKVLLAKRAVEPFKGELDVIGGFLESGEHPATGAIREALEETGVQMQLTEMLGMYTDEYHGGDADHVLNVHYLAEISSGTLKAHDDVAELIWFDIDNLPETHGFQSTKDTLRDLKIWYNKRRS